MRLNRTDQEFIEMCKKILHIARNLARFMPGGNRANFFTYVSRSLSDTYIAGPGALA